MLAATEAWPTSRFSREVYEKIAPLVQTRVVTMSEVPAMVDFLFLEDPAIDQAAWDKTMSADFAGEVLTHCMSEFATCEWNHDALKTILESWTEAKELKLGKTQAPIRVAMTGRTVGPPLFESIEILGRDETIRRLQNSLTRLG